MIFCRKSEYLPLTDSITENNIKTKLIQYHNLPHLHKQKCMQDMYKKHIHTNGDTCKNCKWDECFCHMYVLKSHNCEIMRLKS